jgi:hypothetical protein
MTGVSRATLAGAAFLLLLSLGASDAGAQVTFSTSGVFTCGGCSGSGTNSVTFLGGMGNALMITFNGLGSTSLSGATGTSLGNFQTFFSGNGPINASGTFTLTITQTVPSAGSDTFTATFVATFRASNSGTGTVTFSDGSATIGPVVYTIGTCDVTLHLVPPASNNGITTVAATLVGPTPTPTPTPTATPTPPP